MVWSSCVRDFLGHFSVFVRSKVTVNENINSTDYATGIRFPDCAKSVVNWKMTMTSRFSKMRSSSIFWRCFVSLVKFSYWSKFHVNIITGSGVMTISFYMGLTKSPEIGNTPVRVLLNIWRMWRARTTKFGTNVSNKMLLNAAKCQSYSFYRFWVSKGIPTGRGGLNYPPHPLD